MVDMLDLGSNAVKHVGSSPILGNNIVLVSLLFVATLLATEAAAPPKQLEGRALFCFCFRLRSTDYGCEACSKLTACFAARLPGCLHIRYGRCSVDTKAARLRALLRSQWVTPRLICSPPPPADVFAVGFANSAAIYESCLPRTAHHLWSASQLPAL